MQLSGKSPMTELTPPYCLPHAFRHDRRICEQSSFIGRLVPFFSGVFRNLLSPWLIHFSSDASIPVPVATAWSKKRSARRQSPEYELPFRPGRTVLLLADLGCRTRPDFTAAALRFPKGC